MVGERRHCRSGYYIGTAKGQHPQRKEVDVAYRDRFWMLEAVDEVVRP